MKLLRQFLLANAGARELTVQRLTVAIALTVAVGALGYMPLLSPKHTALQEVVCLGMAGWSFAMVQLLKRRGYHPWISVVSCVLESCVALGVVTVDWAMKGAEYALTAPPVLITPAIIMLTAVRTRIDLALLAGAAPAVVYALMYFVLMRPELGPEPTLTLGPPFVLFRCAIFLFAGAMTAQVARLLMRQAELALKATRELDVMGKYLLHERIGMGGMAEVFRATYSPEGGFAKQVALKRVLPMHTENTTFEALFRREAEIGALLAHPNVVQVLDMGRHQGNLFLAMEYVDGVALQRLLGKGPLPLSLVTHVGTELAAALDYIHHKKDADGRALDLVHRDINPPNVLVSRAGEVKLADFGIVRARGQLQLTEVGSVRGKTSYLSPEQVQGLPFDARADLYALGLTLYELLTQERAFEKALQGTGERGVADFVPPPPSSVRPEVPAALDRVVMGLLQPNPAKRIGSAHEAQLALLALEGAAAPLPEGPSHLVTWVQRARQEQASLLPKGAEVTEAVTVDEA